MAIKEKDRDQHVQKADQQIEETDDVVEEKVKKEKKTPKPKIKKEIFLSK